MSIEDDLVFNLMALLRLFARELTTFFLSNCCNAHVDKAWKKRKRLFFTNNQQFMLVIRRRERRVIPYAI